MNLFVAKFLGTPPINVFSGKVRNGKLYIGEDAVLDLNISKKNDTETKDFKTKSNKKANPKDVSINDSQNVSERDVIVGIRPEGFILQEDGPLCCKLDRVEIMGRDKSVVSTHDCCQNATIRSIIPSESYVENGTDIVRFALKPSKVLIFDAKTEERIR